MKWLVTLLACALPVLALAHDGVGHNNGAEALKHQAETALGPPTDLPFNLGGAFVLTDHTGATRSQADPDGAAQLLFFGYANCPAICAVAMPMMAELTDVLASDGYDVNPVMITVDPVRDTVETMGPALARLHADFVGLTGSEDQLSHVYDLYQVTHEKMFDDPEYGAVYSHGSHIYLLDGTGKVLTLIPPILGVERAKAIVVNYLDPDASS